MEKLQKTLKNTRKRKRERSGSEAGAKRERSGRQENHRKLWKNVEIIESASFPLRSRFVPAPFPLQARGVLTLPWSFQCLGAKGCCHGKITRKHASCIKVNLRTKKFTKLLPPKNHHETLGVLTLPWSFQYIMIYIMYVLTSWGNPFHGGIFQKRSQQPQAAARQKEAPLVVVDFSSEAQGHVTTGCHHRLNMVKCIMW